MLKFVSMLRDSFREAVDGWVIYVMVGASALLILGVASVSFEPVDAENAFQNIVLKFNRVYPDRGHSIAMQPFFCAFLVSDVKKTNDAKSPQEGDYRFVLFAVDGERVVDELKKQELLRKAAKDPSKAPDKKEDETKKEEEKKAKRDPGDSDFRKAVAYWGTVPDKNNPELPDAAKITDDEMVAFIKDQFATFGNMEITKVEKLPQREDGVYAFHVETKGMKGAKGWVHYPWVLFGAFKLPFPATLGNCIFFIENTLINGIGAWVALLVSVVLTAFFIPNMMRKGAIDLLLSKPIMRPTLLIYKYIGGLTFVLVNTTIAVGGVWMVIGLRSGIWSNRFLLIIFGITFFFAILYAVSTLIAVLTRSAIVAILVTCAFWFLMYIAGSFYTGMDMVRKDKTAKDAFPNWVFTTADVMHAVIPRTKDLDLLTTKLIVDDTLGVAEKREGHLDLITFPSWGEVLGVSGAWIAIMLGLACWRFSTRDY
jgi:ABC-type transport system involved in multi-copper enzyme maturation permease subunit